MINSSVLERFLSTFRDNLDYNSNDIQNEINLLIARNNAIEDYLEGNLSVDYLLDLLAEQEIEPTMYIEAVEDEINYLSANPHLLYT